MNLANSQRRLNLNLVDYTLEDSWNSHEFMGKLREKILKMLPSGLFDPQDLEHQILFRLTTFNPKDITDEIILDVIEEQKLIIEERLGKSDFDLDYIFRGLGNRHKDLNCENRLELCWENGKIFARNSHISFEIEFRKVEDEKIISLFTEEFHYIHQTRKLGETFGLFFKGDNIPFAIETTEPSIVVKEYKREALLAHGIDPNKAVELTRFYTLPGSPKNAISVMDGCVSRYYKSKGIEALFTSTMPMYSKTKSTTIAGGMNKVLLVKDLCHKFIPVEIKGKKCYKLVTDNYLNANNITNFIMTNPTFPTIYTVEVFMIINPTSLKPLDILKNKAIKIQRVKRNIEKEIKFKILKTEDILEKLKNLAKFEGVSYIRDTIFGGDVEKLRLRIKNGFDACSVEVVKKYKIKSENNIVTSVEETVFEGNSIDKALSAIREQGKYIEENSYEKIRISFSKGGSLITLDIYPFGSYMEIEGEEDKISLVMESLELNRKDSTDENADECYLSWIRENNLKEQWDVRFGLKSFHKKDN